MEITNNVQNQFSNIYYPQSAEQSDKISFKEFLKSVKFTMEDTITKLAGDEDMVELFGMTVDKNSAATSFLVTHNFNELQNLVSVMMNIVTMFKDLDKSLGQTLSR